MAGRDTGPPRYHDARALGLSANMDLDTLHQQADYLLAVGRCRLGRVPERGEVAGQGQDSSALVLAEVRWFLFQKTIIFFCKIAPISQRLLPVSLQAASHETILRLNCLVLPLGAFRLIGDPLQALLPVAVKPLALSVDDGRAMLEACERAGVTLGTNHHLPGSGIHRTIRHLVADGAVGRILAVRVFHAVMLPERLQGWRLGSRAGGGVAMDITCHDAAVLNPLLGALPADVVALAANQGPWGAAAEDALMSTLRYADGTLVQTHDAFTIAHSPTGLQVLGSEGSIEATAAMVQDPVGTILLRDSSGEREVEPEDRRDLYEINVAAFAAAVRGEGAPTATGLEGLRAVQVALAVREAAESGRRVSITD